MSTRRQRVVALCNAISDLRRGDLHAAFELDSAVPIEEMGPEDVFRLVEGRVVLVRGSVAPPKSLLGRVQTGAELGRIFEDHLVRVMGYGEWCLPSVQKRSRGRQLGGRRFV